MPSLTGKEDDEMEGDQLMFDLDQGFAQGFTQEQVDGLLIHNFYKKNLLFFDYPRATFFFVSKFVLFVRYEPAVISNSFSTSSCGYVP